MSRQRPRLIRDPAEGRIRAGWRIFVAFLVSIAGVTAGDLLLTVPLADSPWGFVVGGAVRLVAVFGVLAVTARLLDRRRLRDYGLRPGPGWWPDLAAGAAVGLAMFSLSTGVALAAGWVRVEEVLSPPAIGGLGLVLALAVFRLATVSLWEELVFRGMMIKNGAEGLGGRWPRTRAVVVAVGVSTVVFAFVHVPQNLGADVPMLSMMAMWLSMGALLAVGYVCTGRLALPLGLHLTVNFALQHLFVLWEPQADEAAAILQFEVVGPAAAAGMGGWLQLGAVAVGHVMVLGWIHWRHGRLRVHPSLTRPPAEVAERRPETGSGAAIDAGDEDATALALRR